MVVIELNELTGKIIEFGGGQSSQFHPNVDIRPGLGVDIVADLEKPLPIEDMTYDAAWSQYCIEHISWRKVKDFLKEVARILKPQGKFVVITANLKEQARVIANKEWGDPKDEFYESRLVFGDLDYPENGHKCGLSPELATKWFQEAGFGVVKVEPHPKSSTDMIIKATKSVPIVDRFTWIKNEIDKLSKNGSVEIVDIGCSDCPVTWQMTNCTWIDTISYEKVVSDMRYFGRNPIPREKFIQASADDLPFENKKFDVALVTELLEHVPNPIDVLKEAKRIAKYAIITVPNEYDWNDKWKPFQNTSHVRHYTEQLLKEHLKDSGVNDYVFGRLDYNGWSFFTAIADLGKTSTVKKKVKKPTESVVSFPQKTTEPVKDRLKIALLSTPFLTVPPKNYGGLEKIVADCGHCMAKEGHDVTIFCPNGSKVDGCNMVYFGEAVDSVHCNWQDEELRAINIVADRIANDGFQIIHGNNWFGFEYALKAKKPELKCCHTHHGGLNTEWWGKSKPPFSLNMIAISEWMKSVYASQGFTSRVVYNGIPTEEYQFKATKGDRLLFVGRLDSFKRPHIAIEVAKQTGLGLDIVGGSFVSDVTYMESIKSQCDGKQVKLYLDADLKTKIELYQNAKAVIFPSKMGEPFGLITPEANSCGTPVIGSRDGAIPEVLQHGVSGFICDTVEEMVEAVKKIDTIDPQNCRKNGERFSRENMARNYVAAYRDIINGKEW